MPKMHELQIRLADIGRVQSILAASGELADAVETYLSPYTRESLIGDEAAMADALDALKVSVTPRYHA